MAVSPARRSAFEILRRVETESAFASVLLASLNEDMREDDRALCHELVRGVLQRRLWLDQNIEHFGARPVEKLDLAVRLALEIGLYQLRFLTRIPASAAVNEAVNLVRVSRVKSAAGFVNAVLRRATRESSYDPLAAIEDPIARLAIETSHPRWLIERWDNAFGPDEAAAFARANNQPAFVAFRFTAAATRDKARERVLGQLADAGAELVPSKVTPDAWRIGSGATMVHRMVDDGLLYLQDEASQLLAHLLQVEANQRVLDITAAPGSKATHIAAIEPTAMVVAGDLYQHRVGTMRRLAARQGAGITVLRHDATRTLPFPAASFDRVLLDAPCSGTGTLRRNPEIRYRLKPDDLAELAAQQNRMLDQAAIVLRPGGRLIYSTCSVEPEENEHVVADFLSNNPDFRHVNVRDVSSFIPHPSSLLLNPSSLPVSPSSLRLWPHRHGTDGFFIASLERNA